MRGIVNLPVAFTLLPGGCHDRTPVHELTVELPDGSWVYGDKGYNSAPDEASIRATGGGVLVPLHKDNMAPNTWAEQCGLRTFRLAIETVNSQLTAMGIIINLDNCSRRGEGHHILRGL